MPKYTKKDRNPLTILLLRHLIESEACWVFGEGRANLQKYLAIPKIQGQTTLQSIRSYRYPSSEIAESCLSEASSVVGKVIQRPKEYKFSDELLDRIANRITFYGRFANFSEFNKHFIKWSRKYDRYKGLKHEEIPKEKLSEIVDDAFDIYSAERIFLRQIEQLNSTEIKGIIRLTDNHIIRQSKDKEFYERRQYRYVANHTGYIKADNAICIDCDLIEENHSLFGIHYTLIGPRCDIVGDLIIIPTLINTKAKLTKEFLEENIDLISFFEQDGFMNPDAIFVRELYGANLNVFYTLMFRLTDIIISHPNAAFKQNTRILVAADEGNFGNCKHIMKFQVAQTELNDDKANSYKKLTLNNEMDFYINDVSTLIDISNNGLGYNLY